MPSAACIIEVAFTCVGTVLWIVVMAWCGEWPYYKAPDGGGQTDPLPLDMWFRRWPKRFGYVVEVFYGVYDSTDRVYFDVDQLVVRNLCACAPSPSPPSWAGNPRRGRWGYARTAAPEAVSDRLQWICPDPAGVAAFMGRVAAVEITALALCPVLALAIAVHAGLVLVDKSPCAVRGALACVALLGAGIVAALVTCVALLADFNARGLPGLGVGAPAESGWGVAPWWLASMLVCIVAAVLSSVAATVCVASPDPNSPTLAVATPRPPAFTAGDGGDGAPALPLPDHDGAPASHRDWVAEHRRHRLHRRATQPHEMAERSAAPSDLVVEL